MIRHNRRYCQWMPITTANRGGFSQRARERGSRDSVRTQVATMTPSSRTRDIQLGRPRRPCAVACLVKGRAIRIRVQLSCGETRRFVRPRNRWPDQSCELIADEFVALAARALQPDPIDDLDEAPAIERLWDLIVFGRPITAGWSVVGRLCARVP